MKKISIVSLLVGLVVVIPRLGWAYNTSDRIQVEVTGVIKAAPCTVIWPPSALNLGLFLVPDLNREGGSGYTQAKHLNIGFVNCPLGTNQVNITFAGTPVRDSGFETTLFANNLVGGEAATDVGLQLFYNSQQEGYKQIGPGTQYHSVPLEVISNHAELDFYARMYTMHKQATPGYFSATVTMNVTYK